MTRPFSKTALSTSSSTLFTDKLVSDRSKVQLIDDLSVPSENKEKSISYYGILALVDLKASFKKTQINGLHVVDGALH